MTEERGFSKSKY